MNPARLIGKATSRCAFSLVFVSITTPVCQTLIQSSKESQYNLLGCSIRQLSKLWLTRDIAHFLTAIGLDLSTLTFWEIKGFSSKPPKSIVTGDQGPRKSEVPSPGSERCDCLGVHSIGFLAGVHSISFRFPGLWFLVSGRHGQVVLRLDWSGWGPFSGVPY